VQTYVELAVDAARSAGEVLLDLYERDLRLETKSSAIDLVTEADHRAERLILDRIQSAYPGHAVLAEESGQVSQGDGLLWLVDPLDGTTNFAHTFPHFGVSIALYEGRSGVVGVVHDPLRDETFFAARGSGAWLTSQRHPRRQLRVTERTSLSTCLLATGFHYSRASAEQDNVEEFGRMIGKVRGIRRAGSAALDLAYVAAGRLDGFWEFHLSPWDTAAGAVLVAEAGGVLRRVDGSQWDPWQPNVVAANARLLEVMCEALKG
jgi:myo-inositol-1(or 4)-monophosphatase